MRFRWLAALAAMAGFCLSFQAVAADQRAPGDYDFYVLALSWSPSFCVLEGGVESSEQCGGDSTYSFVVHGLWPQYEKGYPRGCPTGQRWVPDSLVESLSDIMPSGRLVGGEWRTHGTCSGLSQVEYFSQLRAAWSKIRIPEKFQELKENREYSTAVIEHAFVEANPGLDENGISLSCERGLLRDVRICMTRDLEFRRCDELERKACKGYGLRIPPANER